MPARWSVVLPLAALFAGVTASASATSSQAQVYVIHGVPGVTADVLVDGQSVATDAQPKDVLGPFSVAAGRHEVTLQPATGGPLSAAVDVSAGTSVDVVAHRQVDPAEPPVVTVFPNDLSPVARGTSRVVVAHTAAVPPADIRVNGQVLFSNVANGESLALVVPAATYTVDIVPTGAAGPVVFGPVDVPISEGTLTRVFAFGDPAAGTMDAAVQVLPVAVGGAGVPGSVGTGDGGQAARGDDLGPVGVASLAVLAGGVALLLLARRRRRRS